jgi:hypothetical protein
MQGGRRGYSIPEARSSRPFRARRSRPSLGGMLALIIIALIIWLILAVLGFVIKGLLWLAIIGIILFVITLIVGFIRRGVSRRG